MEYILPPSQYIVCSSISHDSLCRARSTELVILYMQTDFDMFY